MQLFIPSVITCLIKIEKINNLNEKCKKLAKKLHFSTKISIFFIIIENILKNLIKENLKKKEKF